MSKRVIAEVFNITTRYLRSTNLERDFGDPNALESYHLTAHAYECLSRLVNGLREDATERSWRFTGNYGAGKSSFALLLAHWFAGNTHHLRGSLGKRLEYDTFDLASKPDYLPLLVTGSREPMGRAILRTLLRAMEEQYTRGARSGVVSKIARAVEHGVGFSDTEVVEWIAQCNEKLQRDGKAKGILILLDELGKFLEHAAFHPLQQDVFLLQKLAEAAIASGKSPLFLIAILHSGFDVYAENLDPVAQREWDKIGGRFEEILFNQPLAQVSELVAAALKVREQYLLPGCEQEVEAGMAAASRIGWMGAKAEQENLAKLAAKLYPLHATLLPVLVRTFRKFGQNERSLFSFLLSREPFSLQDFADRPLAVGNTYRLPDFYDYVRANFGTKLSSSGYRSHWPEIESMVESFSGSRPVDVKVVKTVGLLNLLDQTDLAPTNEALEAALGGPGGLRTRQIQNALIDLRKRGVLFRRGVSGSYCLWPHTSIDLEAALEKAGKAVGSEVRVGDKLIEILESRPIVARRHYIQSGNLRYFDVRYCLQSELEDLTNQTTDADGRILIALCETVKECAEAVAIANKITSKPEENVLVAIPKTPLINHSKLVADALRWDWVETNTPELNTDRFGRQMVKRQRKAAHERLERRVQDLFGLRSLSGSMQLQWFNAGREADISSARELLKFLSTICDKTYKKAPLISNELINRRNLSSAAAAARMRLIEQLFTSPDKDLLGLDTSKQPPEKSMYLSVLRRAQIHKKAKDSWGLFEPTEDNDPCQVRFTFQAIRDFLEERGDMRSKVSELFSHLEQPPLGVRAGLAPLFLALYSAMHPDDIAFYEDNSFLPEVRGQEFMRISRAPETFEIQLCRIDGLRADVFDSLIRALEIPPPKNRKAQILNVVRPLCDFIAQLPDYARNTRRLSSEAIATRTTILTAKELVKVLFNDLPLACGLKPFPKKGHSRYSNVKQFAIRLRVALDDLRNAYPNLLQRIRKGIQDEFQTNGQLKKAREQLAARAQALILQATEPRLKAICLLLKDRGLEDKAWLESVASLLAQQPPNRWRDAEEDIFNRELWTYASQFRNLESITFNTKCVTFNWDEAFHLALTRQDGSEARQIIYIDNFEAKEIDSMVDDLDRVLEKNRKLGIAAISKIAWRQLKKEHNHE